MEDIGVFFVGRDIRGRPGRNQIYARRLHGERNDVHEKKSAITIKGRRGKE